MLDRAISIAALLLQGDFVYRDPRTTRGGDPDAGSPSRFIGNMFWSQHIEHTLERMYNARLPSRLDHAGTTKRQLNKHVPIHFERPDGARTDADRHAQTAPMHPLLLLYC